MANKKDMSGWLIMTDLDGTFLGNNEERNIEAVRRFQAEGGFFSIATGRAFDPGLPYCELVNSPILFNNGGTVYDCQKKERICVTLTDGMIMKDALSEVQERFQPRDVTIITSGYGNFSVDWEAMPTYEWHKVQIWDSDLEKIGKIHRFMEEKCGDKLNYTYSSPHLLEMFSSQFSKGSMLNFLKGWHAAQGRTVKTVGIGDYLNDFEMIRMADRAFCPANADKLIKSHCEKVLCHHDDGAIADLIETLETEV